MAQFVDLEHLTGAVTENSPQQPESIPGDGGAVRVETTRDTMTIVAVSILTGQPAALAAAAARASSANSGARHSVDHLDDRHPVPISAAAASAASSSPTVPAWAVRRRTHRGPPVAPASATDMMSLQAADRENGPAHRELPLLTTMITGDNFAAITPPLHRSRAAPR